jgi:hypothetical protein
VSIGTSDQIEGKTIALGTLHLADKFYARHDVPPLVVTTDLQSTPLVAIEGKEIEGLQQLIVEFDE